MRRGQVRVRAWVGLGLTVALVGAAGLSWEYRFGWMGPLFKRHTFVVVAYGMVGVARIPEIESAATGWGRWQVVRNPEFTWNEWGRLLVPTTKDEWTIVPLWIPVACAAAPTVLAWRAARRKPPGSCAGCGYDLRGLAAGVCPECGKER